MLAQAGQTVRAGQPLIQVSDAPASALAYRQAADAATFAHTDLARVQRLYDQRLAANDQLGAARKAAADADAALAQQKAQGSGPGGQTLKAPRAGVVTSDHRHARGPRRPGRRADDPVSRRRRARRSSPWSLPPERCLRERRSASIRWSAARRSWPHITIVGRATDPATKTLDAIVPLGASVLPIGSGVRGDVTTAAHRGVVVPRQAIVFDETGPHLFTVSQGKAHRVFVKAGADHGEEVEITGPVTPGTLVAVEGAYELQDGMAVKARAR